MTFCYQGVKVFYKFVGGKSFRPVLLLHGWGCDCSVFEQFMKFFPQKSFLLVDFPPFGKTDCTPNGWNIFTYARMVISLCEHLKIDKCDIVAHSFGGRVAILFCALFPRKASSLVLCDSAGLKTRKSLSYYKKIWTYKLRKRFHLNVQGYGSADYQKLDENMKKVFVEVVGQSLDEYCPLIECPTKIMFGQKDKDTPPYMAKRLHRLIKNSHMCILPNAGHFSFLDSPLVFAREVSLFWEGLR